MSIFPSETVTVSDLIQTTVSTTTAANTTLVMAKEYAWDYVNNDFLLIDGKNTIVTGAEAVKVWMWKALKTPRSIFKAYDDNFGNTFEEIIGQGLSRAALKSELQRCLNDILLINPYITGITDLSLTLDGSLVDATFTAITIYGPIEVVASTTNSVPTDLQLFILLGV